MDAAVVQKLLKSDADIEGIHKKDAGFREMGITGVPTFIVADRHAIGGAQPAHVWQGVIDELTDPA